MRHILLEEFNDYWASNAQLHDDNTRIQRRLDVIAQR